MADFPTFTPGRPISAAELNTVMDLLRRVAGAIGTPEMGRIDLGSGEQQVAGAPGDLWIRITGLASGSATGTDIGDAAYSWEMVERDGLSIQAFEVQFKGIYSELPAFELNNNKGVPSGTVVRAWIGSDDRRPGLEFEYEPACCTAPGPAPNPAPSPVPGGGPVGDCNNGDCGALVAKLQARYPNFIVRSYGGWVFYGTPILNTWRAVPCGPSGVPKIPLSPGWFYAPNQPGGVYDDIDPDLCGLNLWAGTWGTPPEVGSGGTILPPPGVIPPPGVVPPPGEDCIAYANRVCSGIPYGTPDWVRCYNAVLQQCRGGGGGIQPTAPTSTTQSPSSGCGCGGSCGSCGSGDVITSHMHGPSGGPAPNPAPNPVSPGLLEFVATRVDVAVAPTVTPTALSADQNNYAPGRFGLLRLQTDGSADKTVTGLSIGQVDGQIVSVENIDPTFNIKLALNSGSSTTANQWNNGLAAGFDTIAPGGIVTYRYSGAITKWRKIS